MCFHWNAHLVPKGKPRRQSAINLELKSILLLGFCGQVPVNQAPEGEEILDIDVHRVIYQILGASKGMCKIII